MWECPISGAPNIFNQLAQSGCNFFSEGLCGGSTQLFICYEAGDDVVNDRRFGHLLWLCAGIPALNQRHRFLQFGWSMSLKRKRQLLVTINLL
jgi:hypothetical protein